MKVKMTKTAQGSDNGFQVNNYREGETYEVSESLGKYFMDNKMAEESSGDATKGFAEVSADNSQLSVSRRGKVDFDIEGQNEADKEAGIIRPEMDRLLEVSRGTEVDLNDTSTVIEPSGRAKRKVTNAQADNMDASSQGTTAASRAAKSVTTDAPKPQAKALKGTDYQNKAVNPEDTKKGK